jgi:hypothetical protein
MSLALISGAAAEAQNQADYQVMITSLKHLS